MVLSGQQYTVNDKHKPHKQYRHCPCLVAIIYAISFDLSDVKKKSTFAKVNRPRNRLISHAISGRLLGARHESTALQTPPCAQDKHKLTGVTRVVSESQRRPSWRPLWPEYADAIGRVMRSSNVSERIMDKC